MIKRMTLKADRGAALVEYGILVGLISVLAISSVLGLGQKIEEIFGTTTTALSSSLASSVAAAGSEGSAQEFLNDVAMRSGSGRVAGEIASVELADSMCRFLGYDEHTSYTTSSASYISGWSIANDNWTGGGAFRPTNPTIDTVSCVRS
jgi:Flp pilus assembly pilin Flp